MREKKIFFLPEGERGARDFLLFAKVVLSNKILDFLDTLENNFFPPSDKEIFSFEKILKVFPKNKYKINLYNFEEKKNSLNAFRLVMGGPKGKITFRL